MEHAISLHQIDRSGLPRNFQGAISALVAEVVKATVDLYEAVGFEEPWVGYLVLSGSRLVGTCGFKSPPSGGRVEIAYFTFPEFEGRGYATSMAIELVSIAKRADPAVLIAAQTLEKRNASHRVLEKLGFHHVETVDHPDDGVVWEWQLSSVSDT